MTESGPVLVVDELRCRFFADGEEVRAVDGVSFALERGKTLGLVGESGSGKSVTSLAILRLLDERMASLEGSVRLAGKELLALDESEMRKVRGKKIAMIFQDPMTSLNPFLKISRQLSEVLEVHEGLSHREARRRATEMLERVGIGDAGRRIDQYPHQFSGGMRQRVMIAMALLCRPEVLIADEPTTALDVTIQAQILALVKELGKDLGTAVLFITHDLGVIAGLADDVAVMYAGRIVERGTTDDVFERPQHPYTRGLMRSVPRIEQEGPLVAIPGMPPSAARLPSGCAFHPRCEEAQASCREQVPSLLALGERHAVRCPFAEGLRG